MPLATVPQKQTNVIEQYTETDLWLQKMLKLTYTDDSGRTIPAFDPKAAQSLLEFARSNPTECPAQV